MLFNAPYCPGYSGNGFSCVDINECEVNNGGCSVNPRVDCTNTRGSRTCGPCPPGKWNSLITEINSPNDMYYIYLFTSAELFSYICSYESRLLFMIGCKLFHFKDPVHRIIFTPLISVYK